jgi:catabolite regulation protein CreA
LSDHTDLLNLVAEDEYGDDPDVADVQITNCELAGQPTIISAEDGVGVAEIEVRFKFTAEITRPDESSRIYDSEEKRVWYFAHETALVDGSATVTLTVDFTYDEEDPSDVTILEINPDDETRHIDLGRAIFESDGRDRTE